MATDASSALRGIESGEHEHEEEGLCDPKTIYAINALVLHGNDSALRKRLASQEQG